MESAVIEQSAEEKAQAERFAAWQAARDARIAAYKASPAGQAEHAKRSAASKKAAATRAARKASEAEVAASMEPLKVGDFFSASWGYDQTNVDFFMVVEVSATGKTVKVIGVGKEFLGERGGPSESVVPLRPVGPIDMSKAHRVQPSPSGGWGSEGKRYWSFNFGSHKWFRQWDGKPEYQTGLGWGH